MSAAEQLLATAQQAPSDAKMHETSDDEVAERLCSLQQQQLAQQGGFAVQGHVRTENEAQAERRRREREKRALDEQK
jgi:hypothetical protein